ncbi:MAG: hypothetical protein WD969_06165 [Paracoccaceae bacterium]
MARLRTWAEWDALTGDEALSDVERELARCCKAGERCTLGDGKRPDGPSAERSIRAGFLRYLILGGCEDWRTDEWGVPLVGAYVEGVLDLSLRKARGQTGLFNCRFAKPLHALQTAFEFLNLSGSAFPGMKAQGANVTGGVFLRQSEAEGEVRLAGAKIGGQLICDGAKLCNADGIALNAQGAEVTDGIFLRNAETEGEVTLSGAKIGGQLDCNGATLSNAGGHALNAQGAEVARDVSLRHARTIGEVSLSGAKISGQLSCSGAKLRNPEGKALNAQRLHVTEGLFWRNVRVEVGSIDLVSAHTGDLADDPESWPASGRLHLDGFTFDRISGAFIDVPRRLAWLEKGTRWQGAFFPQPYTQLAKVYREMGHERSARRVLMERENLVRREGRKDARKRPAAGFGPRIGWVFRLLFHPLLWLWDRALRFFAGYGYAPGRSVFALLALFVIAVVAAHFTWEKGGFAPNSAPILVSDDWKDYVAADCAARTGDALCASNPAAAWSAMGAPGADWDSFNRYGYAADLVVPILDLGQTAAWAPSKDRGAWGHALWWGRWAFASLGWFFAALGAAAVTGIIRRD